MSLGPRYRFFGDYRRKYPGNAVWELMKGLVCIPVLISFVVFLSACGGTLRPRSGAVMRSASPVEVALEENIARLLQEEDTDGDRRITI